MEIDACEEENCCSSKMLNIQLASDIHLEYYGKHKPLAGHFIKPVAPYLCLCGDIGNPFDERYAAFLKECSDNFEHVFLIAGNHEYFIWQAQFRSMNECLEKIQNVVAALPNVHFLNRQTYEILPGIHIVGCTLWSHIFKMYHVEVKKYSNDLRNIRKDTEFNRTEFITLEDVANLHAEDVTWLEGALAKIKSQRGKAVVMTHHLPTYELIHEHYKDCVVNCVFATELPALIAEPVIAWFCGHTHMAKKIVKNGVLLQVNPFGGPYENVGRRHLDCVISLNL